MINLDNISFDHCLKCTICTVYCPVARVSPLYPGPKQSGPDAERLRIKNPELVDESLKYCNNCKRCEIACPSDVRIADMIQSARWKRFRRRLRIRDFILSRTDLVGTAASALSGLVNRLTGLPLTRRLLELFLGISRERVFPEYDQGTFTDWFRKNPPPADGPRGGVIYFPGCYVNYNNHQLGRDVVRVLTALGVGVGLADTVCCGVPLIANGYLVKARNNARRNMAALNKAAGGSNKAIVSASSSCAMALRHEYKNVLELDNSYLAEHTEYITRFLFRLFEEHGSPAFKPLKLKAAYHAPCHLERQGAAVYTVETLRMIPGLDLRLLHSECCGLSGTYGFKKELYQISQDVGRDLFRRIDAAAPDLVVTDCETCKWQIEMNTPYEVVHPVTLLARALGNAEES